MKYKSLIVPELEVDIANLLTEIVMQRKGRNMPKCEFWRNEYSKGYEGLKDEYVLELTAIRGLLKVFSPDVVAEHIKNTKVRTIRFLKAEWLKDLVYSLYKKQIKYLDTLSIPKADLELSDNKINFIETKIKQKNAISQGL